MAFFLLVFTFGFFFWLGPNVLAYDFPGKGDAAAWSEALPHYNLANRYLEANRLDEALEHYERAVELYQYDADFYVNLGVTKRKLQDYRGAETAFRQAIAINKQDWLSWSNLANSLLKQDRLSETIAAFEECLKRNPPKSEREAILKDIADIKKVLSYRGGGSNAGSAGGAKPVSASKQNKKQAAVSTAKSTIKTGKKDQKEDQKEDQQKDQFRESGSGWDYVR